MKSVRPPAYSILASLYEGVENVSSNFDSDYNIISLSCHEQVSLSGLLVHDMINLLYYEYWTDKQKYLYVYLIQMLTSFITCYVYYYSMVIFYRVNI